MVLQNLLIKDFRQKHPKMTYRQIGQLTGIQLTRVFRIFNGAPMKLNEWEAFQKLTNPKNESSERQEVMELAEKVISKLSSNGINDVKFFLGRKLQLINQRVTL